MEDATSDDEAEPPPPLLRETIKRYGLNPIDRNDRRLFERYFDLYREPISDMCFASIYMYAEQDHYFWKEYGDNLVIYSLGSKPSMLLPPLGTSINPDAIKEGREILRRFDVGEIYIDYASKEQVVALGDPLITSRSGDYIYGTDTMISLSGSAYHSQRNHRNAFIKRYEGYTRTYSDDYKDPCKKLLSYIKFNSGKHDWKFEQEIDAIHRILNSPKALGLDGIVTLVNGGELVGFTFGTQLTDSMCNITTEKTNKHYAGSAQFIFSEFCKHWKDSKWCNTGDDWEIPSLVVAKESYRPARRIPKWSVSLNGQMH